MRNWLVLVGIVAATGCGSSGNDLTCGNGTTLVGDTCEAGSGSGSGDVCGTGTHVDTDGVTCVPDGPGATGAPTITLLDPTDAGIAGGALFTITGTGFAGDDVTSLTVFFGDTTDANCQATVGAANATMLTGQVPEACALSVNVTVTVTTNFGSATTPFQYDILFAADGDANGNFGGVGDLYVIDPFLGASFDLGPLVDAAQTAYGIGGIAFDSTGTLWGVTTGDSAADVDGVSQLVMIAPDLADGVGAVTVIGDAVDGDGGQYFVEDIKFSGGVLYGWAYIDIDGEGDFNQTLVSISTADGTVTPIGDGAADSFGFAGMAVDGGGNLVVAANGAGAEDDTIFTTGELDSVSTTTGDLTAAATLDLGAGVPVQAMSFLGTSLVAVLDAGSYGDITGGTFSGEFLALIDPAANPIVTPLFELAGEIGNQAPHVDAIDFAPATLVIARKLPRAGWQRLDAARVPAKH